MASVPQMLSRGATKRCPRCGSRHLFQGWFRMKEHCPRCGLTFDREEGFFLGAFVLNFGVTIAGLAVIMGVLIAVLATNGSHRALVSVAVTAVAEVVVVPLAFYPTSKTLWCAVDIVMHKGESWAKLPSE